MQDEVQERAHTLGEVPSLIDWYFLDEPAVDPAAWEKAMGSEAAPVVLDGAIAAYAEAAVGERPSCTPGWPRSARGWG